MKNRSCFIFLLLAFVSLATHAEEFSAEDKKLIEELGRMEYRAAKFQEKLDDINAFIELQTDIISDFSLSLELRNKSLEDKKKQIDERIASLIKYSVPERLSFLLLNPELRDASRAEAILLFMLRREVSDYKELEEERQLIDNLKVLLVKEKQKLEQSRVDYDKSLEQLKLARNEKSSLLRRVKRSGGAYKALVDKLEKGREKMSYFMEGGRFKREKLSEEHSKTVSAMIRPVDGSILRRFGRVWDSRIRNWVYNRGVTLSVEQGQKVMAAEAGSISYSGWITGYGNVLILRHKDELFSVYAHLARTVFNLGDAVSKGAVIAYAGDSGSVDTPSLYFELRQGRNNIDPTPLFD